jgi:Zinc knuckle
MEIDRAKSQVGCFRCGEKGHMIKQCPISKDGLRCKACGKFGHMEKACRGKGRQVREVDIRQTWAGMQDNEKETWLREVLAKQPEPVVEVKTDTRIEELKD